MMRQRLIAAVAVLTLLPLAGSAHQDAPATPPDDGGFDEEGVRVEILSDTQQPLPGTDDTYLVLYRLVLAPGGAVAEHDHHGTVTFVVESGELAYTVIDGEAFATCAAGCGEGGEPGVESPVPVGEEIFLAPGDAVTQYDTTAHAYRNTADGETVVLATSVYTMVDDTTADSADGGATPAAMAAPPSGRGSGGIRPTGCSGGCK